VENSRRLGWTEGIWALSVEVGLDWTEGGLH